MKLVQGSVCVCVCGPMQRPTCMKLVQGSVCVCVCVGGCLRLRLRLCLCLVCVWLLERGLVQGLYV